MSVPLFTIRDVLRDAPLRVKIAAAAVLLALLTLWLWPQSQRVEVLSLVELPVQFRECSAVRLREPPAPYIATLVENARLHNLTVSTAAHWGFGFCMMILCERECYEVLNPTYTTEGRAQSFMVHEPLLCRRGGQVRHFPELVLRWQSADREEYERRFSGEMAYRVQLGLDVLAGRPICG